MTRDLSGLPRAEPSIRPARAEDTEGIGRLVAALGSQGAVREVAERLAAIGKSPDHQVLVAEDPDGGLVGWIHVFAAPRLTVATFAEIGGLVVDEDLRGRGIGRLLVFAAVTWAQRRGLTTLRVRSRVERAGAHRFYRRLGFGTTKQQEVLEFRVASGRAEAETEPS